MNPHQSISVGADNHAAIHPSSQIKPEWLRIPDAIRTFGLCRSSLYELITAGTIKSRALKKRGAVRGIRLISFDSLAAYVEGTPEDSKPESSVAEAAK